MFTFGLPMVEEVPWMMPLIAQLSRDAGHQCAIGVFHHYRLPLE